MVSSLFFVAIFQNDDFLLIVLMGGQAYFRLAGKPSGFVWVGGIGVLLRFQSYFQFWERNEASAFVSMVVFFCSHYPE